MQVSRDGHRDVEFRAVLVRTLSGFPLFSIVLMWIYTQGTYRPLNMYTFYFLSNLFPHLYTPRCVARHNSVCQVLCFYCSYKDISSQ